MIPATRGLVGAGVDQAGRGDDAEVDHVGAGRGQAGDERRRQHLARPPRVATEDDAAIPAPASRWPTARPSASARVGVDLGPDRAPDAVRAEAARHLRRAESAWAVAPAPTIVTGTVPGLMASSSTPAGSPTMAGVNEWSPGARPAASSDRRHVAGARAPPSAARPAEGDRQLIEPGQAGVSPAPWHTTPTTKVRLETDGTMVATTVTVATSPSARLTPSGSCELDLEGLIRRCAVDADRRGRDDLDLGEVLGQAARS